MRSSEGTERSLEAEEQALYDVVLKVAGDALEAGVATLGMSWYRFGEQPSWPIFELRPPNRDALPIAVSVGGGDWIDTGHDVDGTELNFELWAATPEQRLRRTGEWIEAAIAGRVQLELRRSRWLWLSSWTIVVTFDLAGGPDVTSRSPAPPSEYGHLFPRRHGDEASGLLGPRRFAEYASDSAEAQPNPAS